MKRYLMIATVLSVLAGLMLTGCMARITVTPSPEPENLTWSADYQGGARFYDTNNAGHSFYVKIDKVVYEEYWSHGTRRVREVESVLDSGQNMENGRYRSFTWPAGYYKIYVNGRLCWSHTNISRVF